MPNLGDEDHSEDEEDDHNNVIDQHTSNGNFSLKSSLFYKKIVLYQSKNMKRAFNCATSNLNIREFSMENNETE
jgi:hypothetical protein